MFFIQFATDEFKADRDIVLAAVELYGHAHSLPNSTGLFVCGENVGRWRIVMGTFAAM